MPHHSNKTSARQDVYSEITSHLVAAIEADPGKPDLPWRKSSCALLMPANALTQNVYNGVNVVSLWIAAEVKNFTSPVWATCKQWLTLGTQVRKDEKSSLIVFYQEFETGPNPDDASTTANAASPAHPGYSTPPRLTDMRQPSSLIRSVPSSASPQPTCS